MRMPIIDDRGRLFGRVNLVDAAIVGMALVLLPIAYGAYLLFKEPTPHLSVVNPKTLRQGPNLQVEVRGENFRPYMRVSFADKQGRTFLFSSPTLAVVELPDLLPGTYDVVLYDYMQEVSRLPQALTIDLPPTPPSIEIELAGVLTALTPEQVKQIAPGHKLPETGYTTAEVLSVGTPVPEVMHIRTGDKSTLNVPVEGSVQLPVRLRTRCFVETTDEGSLRCRVSGIPLAPDANIVFLGLGTRLNLRVSEVHYPGRSRAATVTVRFVMSPEVRSRIKAGDRDIGARAFPAGEMATLVSLADRGDASASLLRDGIRQAVASNRIVAVDAVVTVPVEDTPVGLMYKGAPVKIGKPFSFETATYGVDGGVIDLVLAEPAATK
jgi:hypothetical protein